MKTERREDDALVGFAFRASALSIATRSSLLVSLERAKKRKGGERVDNLDIVCISPTRISFLLSLGESAAAVKRKERRMVHPEDHVVHFARAHIANPCYPFL